MSDEIKAFVAERDAVLLSGDVDKVMALHAKYNPTLRPMTRDEAELSMHKARTAVTALPMEARVASFNWLRERGFGTLDDGELEPSARTEKQS